MNTSDLRAPVFPYFGLLLEDPARNVSLKVVCTVRRGEVYLTGGPRTEWIGGYRLLGDGPVVVEAELIERADAALLEEAVSIVGGPNGRDGETVLSTARGRLGPSSRVVFRSVPEYTFNFPGT